MVMALCCKGMALRDTYYKSTLSLETILLPPRRPTLDFLHYELGVPRERMGKLIAHHPQILGYSVNSKLKPTVRVPIRTALHCAALLRSNASLHCTITHFTVLHY